MNDLRRRLNTIFGAPRPDFAQLPARLKPSEMLRTVENGGTAPVLRPIRPEDEPAMRRFHALLSEETIYERYFKHFTLEGRIDHGRLSQICTNGPDSLALVVESSKDLGQPAEILAVGRLTTTDAPYVAAFAILMRVEARNQEFDSIILQRLIVLVRAAGFKLLVDDNLVSNHDLLNLCKKLGFTLHLIQDESIVRVCLCL